MIRIHQIKLPITHTQEDLKKKIGKILRISVSEIREVKIVKQSIDARKKPQIFYTYTVDAAITGEKKILQKVKSNQIMPSPSKAYRFNAVGEKEMRFRPIIVGSGPAGLFVHICFRYTVIVRFYWSAALR